MPSSTALFMRSARGYVTVGMAHRGYDLQLTRDDEKGWRATFYARGMEHSPTSATGSAWERTPWRAVQGGARDALRRTVDDQAAPREEGDKSEGRQPQLPGARDMAPASTTTHVLPMQLKIRDGLSDETGDYEVIGQPYTTAVEVGQHVK